LAAFIATFVVLLVFGLTVSNPSAFSAEQDVTPSSLTEEEARAGDTAKVTGEPAVTTPSTVPATPPASGGEQTGGSSTGGVAPTPGSPSGGGDDAVSGGSDGNTGDGGNGGSGPREPDFVEQDPSLSDGGVSPGSDGAGTFEIDRLNVPNFVINNFEIPPFLLPIYQACGSEYGIPWEVLASINRAETTFGTNVGDSSAGAMGWMMFMPASWAEWGVDANGDKIKDPYNPVDAICAAGNYLEYFGYAEDPYEAIFAYNHADWYVQLILEYAQIYSAIPPEMISALTGLTEGARFPIAAESSYEGEISTEAARKEGTASQDVSSSADRTAIAIQSEGGAPVIAVNDGEITDIDSETGTVVLEDVYGNRYSYAGLGSIASVHPVPQHEDSGDTQPSVEDAPPAANDDADASLEMGTAKASEKPAPQTAQADSQVQPEALDSEQEISEVLVDPDAAAQAAANQAAGVTDDTSDEPMNVAEDRRAEQEQLSAQSDAARETMNTEDMRGRTYASPLRPSNQNRATIQGQSTRTSPTAVAMSGGVEGKPGDYLIYDGSKAGVYRFKEGTAILKPLRKGSKVIAGTVLGRLTEQTSSSLTFSIQPGGEDTPQIDPKPFLDGWRLLAETNIYNAQGKNRFADRLGVGGVLLLSKSALQRRVLADENISLPECDRQYIAGGAIDRRVLAALAFASEKGYELLITSMYCGREVSITTSGNISNHSNASAADIAAINGEVVTAASQGPGSLTDQLAREFLSLQGIMAPDEVITLLAYPQPAGFAMGDHDDHLHIGYSASGDANVPGGSVQSTLGAEQWTKLTERLGQITNPEVPTAPSDDALPAEKSDQGN